MRKLTNTPSFIETRVKSHKSSGDKFISNFKKSDDEARSRLLLSLTRQLRPAEWNLVYGQLVNRGYFFDILANVPLETALGILEYLSPADLLQLRRVNSDLHHTGGFNGMRCNVPCLCTYTG